MLKKNKIKISKTFEDAHYIHIQKTLKPLKGSIMYFCKDLIKTLWDIRHKSTEGFKNVLVDGMHVFSRVSEITVLNHGDESEGTPAQLIYADQNPRGYSTEADLVRNGYLKNTEVGWLFIHYPELNKNLWLAKIVRACPTVIRDCKFDPSQKKIWLYKPRKEIYYKVIPISTVLM